MAGRRGMGLTAAHTAAAPAPVTPALRCDTACDTTRARAWQHMLRAGYETHMYGKWDCGMATPDHIPLGRG